MRVLKLLVILIALSAANVPCHVAVRARRVMRRPPAPQAGRSRSMVKPRLPPPPPPLPPPPVHHHHRHGVRSVPRPPPPYPPRHAQPLRPSPPPPPAPLPCHH
ncbi:hypothetical protein GQ55_9G187400 [Panicum hallii var. hallii]|uniref:Extensin domain-containing protein n=1 Tax=Panicum hallii var. hallii TaxID=1504633 RepID=A0A2T7C506_9POAL|nr:hypothetical protein GQ55_9G187400 [Panicum hallii var. hallii]